MKKGLVNWGILGTADIAKTQMIPGMKLSDHCRLYAIAGRDPEKARQFSDMFGFEKYYSDYDELIEDPDVQAVYIPLPNNLHCEWTIKALKAKKHVLCEKPLAVSEKQAAQMFAAAEENGVYLMEAFAYLHSPFIQEIGKVLLSGKIGSIRYFESAFVTGRRPDTDIRLRRETFGGAWYDLGCYPLSMCLWLLKKEPETVQASAQFSDRKIDLFTSALLQFSPGCIACLNCGMVLPDGRLDRLQIYGSTGEISSPYRFNQCGEISYTLISDGNEYVQSVSVPNNYMLEADQLSRCILYGEKPYISKDFSIMTARITDRILNKAGY